MTFTTEVTEVHRGCEYCRLQIYPHWTPCGASVPSGRSCRRSICL